MTAAIDMPRLAAMPAATITAAMDARVWPRVTGTDPDGCWNWTGKLTLSGYACVNIQKVSVYVHRLTYRELIAEVPEGLQLDHLCRNRACCNPWHLEPVTNRINSLRGVGPTALNAERVACPKGHPYDSDNAHVYQGRRYCKTCAQAASQQRGEAHNAYRRSRTKKALGIPRKLREPKTHCKHGHEFTTDNTYVKPSGSRQCRACQRRLDEARRLNRGRVA